MIGTSQYAAPELINEDLQVLSAPVQLLYHLGLDERFTA